MIGAKLGEAHNRAHTFPIYSPWNTTLLFPMLRNNEQEQAKENEFKFDLFQIPMDKYMNNY